MNMEDIAMVDLEDLDQVLAMSPGSSSATPAANAAAAAAAGSSDGDGDGDGDLRRGPWTVEEDILLVNYIAAHGEGRWNSLARSAGLKRTGKSCRLRWLNYLRPDVRRGNITAGEQLLILDLHSRWGNRWSKIAQQLPGRTDNEIKNYWRTRVQKHARQLRCDVNSAQFRHVVRHIWMPRLLERFQAEEEANNTDASAGAGAGADGGGVVVQVQPLPPAPPVVGGVVQAPPTTTTTTTASAPPAGYGYGHPHQQQIASCWPHVVPAASKAHRPHLSAGDNNCYYSEPAGQTTATALSPDDASSALRSPLTTDASQSQHHTTYYYYNTSSSATPTNDDDQEGIPHRCGGDARRSGPTTIMMTATADADDDDDDVFAGTSWSELLATATATGADDDSTTSSVIGLPDFGFGEFEDSNLWSLDDSSLWSLDDLCLHQLC